MAHAITANGGLFRDRDFFVHDGSKLRRFRLSAPVQAVFFFILMALVGWSAFAAAQMIAGTPNSSVASVAAAAEQRASLIEQRQHALAAMLAGEQVDPRILTASTTDTALPASIAAPLARAEQAQRAQAALAAQALDARYRTAAAELKRLGINPARMDVAVGGPFEPAAKADPTFKQLFMSWKKLDNLQVGAIAVPSEKPVKVGAFTSGYGVRSDPFQGRAAMHAGIDLSGPVGTPIYATADGIVSEAGWNGGGYGNLVKLNHGRGIETRYGHLSSIAVRPGQQVKRGDLIARMGSTGRSTGSHLHYEVRIDGRAVNPIPFMKSTDYLVAMQRSASAKAMDQVALGGPNGARR